MLYDLVSERRSKYCVKVTQPDEAYSVLKRYAKKTQEHFLIVTLNSSHVVISVRIITVGLLNRTLIHPREIFRQAITDNAESIIIAHNHPSGVLDPSVEDLEITKRIKQSGDLIGIPVLDHLIISEKGFLSLNNEGMLR